MAKAFDASAFIVAEDERLAAAAKAAAALPASPKTGDFCGFDAPATPCSSEISSLARPLASNTPWAEKVEAFIASDRPEWVPAGHWDELIGEAEAVERQWGDDAAACGWSVLDLYGCPRTPLAPVHGQSGLVHLIVRLLTPVRLTSLGQAGATLAVSQGAPMRFRPSPRIGAVPLWDAYRMNSGP